MNTLFLSASPSFLSGAARILDLGGVYDSYNLSSNAAEADAKALYSDWAMTGEDLQASIDGFDAEHASDRS
jgi:hypothetical protein